MADTIHNLRPDPRNARRHNPRNVGMIQDALQEVGAARSIVIDENDVILAGNATIEAAGAAGIEKMQIVDADGETIIAVRRRGLTDEQKQRLALFDNRTGELADWDASILEGLRDDDLLDGLFYDEELDRLLATVEDAFDPRDEWEGMPEFAHEDMAHKLKVIVKFESEEDMKLFERTIDQAIPKKTMSQTASIWFPKKEPEVMRNEVYMAESDES